MVKIETEKENLKGILIDGYTPNLENLREIDWKELRNHLPKTEWYSYGIPKYLQKDLSEKQILKIFGTLVYGLRYKFCQFKNQDGKTRASVYFPYTSGNNYFSLERQIAQFHKKELAKYLPTLIREYNHDKEVNRKNYLQNLIIYCMHPSITCNRVDECNDNWLKRTGFEIKKGQDYKNYGAFKDVWKEITKYLIKNTNDTKRFDINRII